MRSILRSKARCVRISNLPIARVRCFGRALFYSMPIEPEKIDDEFASPEERRFSYFQLFLDIKERLVQPQYRDYVGIDKAMIFQMVGMYLLDRERIKKETGIAILHRSKVAAYMAKWALHFRPIYTTFDSADYENMSLEVSDTMLNLNYYYAVHVIFHALDELLPQDFYPDGKYSRVLADLVTNMRRGSYDANLASLLFDAITVEDGS